MEIEQDEIVICTVEEISGTTVFVKIRGTDKTGSIVFSEISPGRIRNIRDFVVPKKTIVCKVLKINQDNIELSLRRVKEKEKKEILERDKLEKSYTSVLKSILKEKTDELIEEISKKEDFLKFMENIKTDIKDLKKLVGEENAKKIEEILKNQKTKKALVKKEIEFYISDPKGIELIKEILENTQGIEIKYIAAGKYSLKKEDSDMKKADNKLKEFIINLEKKLKVYNTELKYK